MLEHGENRCSKPDATFVWERMVPLYQLENLRDCGDASIHILSSGKHAFLPKKGGHRKETAVAASRACNATKASFPRHAESEATMVLFGISPRLFYAGTFLVGLLGGMAAAAAVLVL